MCGERLLESIYGKKGQLRSQQLGQKGVKNKHRKMCDYEKRMAKTKHKKMTVLEINMKEERTAQGVNKFEGDKFSKEGDFRGKM